MPPRHQLVFTPVHRQVDGRRVEPWGTGTLITFGTHNVLVSAAHVFAQARSFPLLLPGKPHFTRVVGPAVMSDLAATAAGVDDPYDVGFVYLSHEQSSALNAAGMRFLASSDIATDRDIESASRCVFCGYPISQSETQVGPRIISSTPFYADCQILFSKDRTGWYIIGKYDREAVILDATEQRVTGPEAWGCSGGPVWIPVDDGQPKLAAIGTFYDPQKKRLRGTRLSILVQEILSRAPKLG